MAVSSFRNWLKRRALNLRLLTAIVVTEAIVFGALVVVSTLRLTLAGTMGLLAALFLVSVCLLIYITRTAIRRLAHMTDRIQRHATSGDLVALLPIDQDDEIGRLASAFNQLITANRQALERLNARADDLAMLNMLAATISQTLDLQQVLDISLRQALNAVDWDAGSIYLWDERTASFNMVSFVNLPEDYIREVFSYELGGGIIGRAAQKGQILITEGNVDEVAAPSGLATHISIPLKVPGRLLGVLDLGSEAWRRPESTQLVLLTTIGHQIAVALEKAQLHHDLSMHAEELEGIVAARTEQLAQAIDELSDALEHAREADKVKSQLLSTVSHELRTPLATIKGHTSMLVDHYRDATPEMLRDSLTDIEEETDKLTELISNLLEMSRIEAGVLHIQPQTIDLIDVVRSTVEAAKMRVTSHPINMETPGGRLPVYADARRLQQILDNLLDNAAKYSAQGQPITVTVTARDKSPIIRVKDRGQGIPTDHLDKIFDRFYQIEAGDDRSRGIGLGLAICRGLVAAHGGRIWVSSEYGRGSSFAISLPTDGSREIKESLAQEQS